MPHAELTSELRASRPWVLTMAWLGLFFIALWCLWTTSIWLAETLFKGGIFPKFDRNWMEWYYKGFFIQLTLYAFAAIIPFVNLLRYAMSLGALQDGLTTTLERSLQLNRTFWTHACYLAWGMAWLVVYMISIATLGVLLHWE